MFLGEQPEPLMNFIIDKDLIAASDLITQFTVFNNLTDIKIALVGCKIFCIMNREDLVRKNGSKILAQLSCILEWI